MENSLRRAARVLIAALICVAPVASATAIEQELKAAYIYNFIRFVEWPGAPPAGDLNVCVVGPRKVQSDMRRHLDGKRVGDRVIHVRAAYSPRQTSGCHVLYVAGRDAAHARRFTAAVPRDRVLTITEADRFPVSGGLINFYQDQDTIRFAVDADLLAQSHFKLSSQMLQFGTMVTRGVAQ